MNKIKRLISLSEKQNIFIVLIVILTSCASFGLGRLSKISENKTPLQINNSVIISQSQTSNSQLQDSASGKYVASKNGKKYHLLWCSGAQTISEKNKIWFNSKEDAEKAGYTPASNCKGI